MLRPAAFGSDIQRYDLVSPPRHLIYPYRAGAVIAETEFRDLFPRTFEYLDRYREALASRASIAAGGLKWYELVRKRDERWLTSRKLLTRDLATETSFALDNTGETFLVGGTAVVPEDSSLAPALLAYLNSKLINEYLGQITPMFKQGFQKFEPQHLEQVPVLDQLVNNREFSEMLGELAGQVIAARGEGRVKDQRTAEAAIDDQLRSALEAGDLETV